MGCPVASIATLDDLVDYLRRGAEWHASCKESTSIAVSTEWHEHAS
jgi:hypothetical protein